MDGLQWTHSFGLFREQRGSGALVYYPDSQGAIQQGEVSGDWIHFLYLFLNQKQNNSHCIVNVQ